MNENESDKQFYFYVDDYVDRMVGESLFDHDMGEEEEEEVKEEEVKEVSLDDLLV